MSIMRGTGSASGSSLELEHGSIGLPNVIFMSVALMGPGIAVAYDYGPSIPYAGITLPLATLLAMVLMLCTANSIGQLGRVYADAGGLYAYVAKALGRRVGFMTGWINLFFQPFFAVLLYLMLANVFQSTLELKAGVLLPAPIFILFSAGVVYVITVVGVKTSTNIGVILGVFEITVLLALALWIIFSSGSHNTLHAFDPRFATESGFVGVGKGAIFAILAFVGFEGAAVLGEESRDPFRLIPRGVIFAALIVGAFFCITAYAGVIGWGTHDIASYATNSNPWLVIATKFWGVGWVVVFLALINSGVANAAAGVNSCSRVFFSMGREGMLPKALAKVHPRFRTPSVAIATNTIVATVIALLADWAWGPLVAFGVTATAFVVLVIVWYMLANVACVVEYTRRRRAELKPIVHIVIPTLGFVIMLLPLYYTYHPLSPYPVRIALFFAPAWIVAGGIVLAILEWKAPRIVDATQAIFMEEGVDPAATARKGTPMLDGSV